MKKQVQSMWMYCILVVCVAILLIVISVISETQVTPTVSYQEQTNFTKTVSDSVSTLIENNNQLEATIAEKNKEISDLNTAIGKYQLILEAADLYDNDEPDAAKEKLKDITTDGLSEEAVAIYNTVMEIETEE